jgi:AcrR family transcriptional regulator
MLATLMRAQATSDDPPRQQGAKLDRATIVAAALSLVEREGADAVTMRRLGAELGADPTAVYRHFRNKEALLDAIADYLFARTLESWQLTGDWRNDLREIALSGFRLYQQHPSFAIEFARQRDDTPTLAAIAEAIIARLRAAGLSDPDAAIAYHSVIDTIVGAGVFHAVTQSSNDSEESASTRRSLAALPQETHPNAVAISPHLYPDDDVVFRFTIELLLNAIELRASRTRMKEDQL